MIVGNRKRMSISPALVRRSQISINYAVDKIRKSNIAPFVKKLYLYGSCARNEQKYTSDVDLLLELREDFDSLKFKDDIILLKGSVTPSDLNLPEIDLKVVVGDSWRQNKMLYYQNIKTEGIDLWETQ